jgi:hypothetical protein
MPRGEPGWRLVRPARSRVNTICWTEGRVQGDAEVPLHPPFGRRPAIRARVGVDEGQIPGPG